MRVERGEGGDRVVVQRGYGLGVQGEQGVAGERLGVESGICRDGGGRFAEVVGEERCLFIYFSVIGEVLVSVLAGVCRGGLCAALQLKLVCSVGWFRRVEGNTYGSSYELLIQSTALEIVSLSLIHA